MSPPQLRRIFMTADAVGGVWVFATSLAAALVRQGIGVVLATLGPPPRPDQRDVIANVDGIELITTDFALEWMEPGGADARRARDSLAALADRSQPDVIHLNGYREALADWPAPVVVSAHSCVRSWWRACHRSEPPQPQWHNYMENVAAGLAAADLWAAPTAAFRDTIAAIYAPPRPGRVIHNGIEITHTAAAKEPFILAAGRLWDEGKNIAALAAVGPKLPWPVRIAGADRIAHNSAALDSGLHVHGELARLDLLTLMRRAAIFAAPARYEPFGLAVLEAAAAGCALVLSDIPSLRELWEGTALFVDPDDCAALFTALDRLCREAPLRQHLQQAAARRARRYSLSAMAADYRHAYEHVLAVPASGQGAQALQGACA